MTLGLPGALEGRAPDVLVKAKYGLKNIEWQSATLNAAGGKIVAEEAKWFIQLPGQQPGTAEPVQGDGGGV